MILYTHAGIFVGSLLIGGLIATLITEWADTEKTRAEMWTHVVCMTIVYFALSWAYVEKNDYQPWTPYVFTSIAGCIYYMISRKV